MTISFTREYEVTDLAIDGQWSCQLTMVGSVGSYEINVKLKRMEQTRIYGSDLSKITPTELTGLLGRIVLIHEKSFFGGNQITSHGDKE